jgi:cytosine/adenosine deaminase-related metal-dependent hydrolase
MKKRSKYRPKGKLINPVAYVLESLKPVRYHDGYLIDLKIKNHGSMEALTKGNAGRTEIDLLINMGNTTEALYRLGFGEDYGDVVEQGLDALHEVGKRGIETGRFILKAHEMSHLNLLMELHDAQMEVITVKDMERAADLIGKEFDQRKMRRMKT